jgi:hypothetical protein
MVVVPCLCKEAQIKEERQSTNFVEGTETEEGSKWQKRWSEVNKNIVVGREYQGK